MERDGRGSRRNHDLRALDLIFVVSSVLSEGIDLAREPSVRGDVMSIGNSGIHDALYGVIIGLMTAD